MGQTSNPSQLTAVLPGAGNSADLGSIGVQFKLWGEDTGGAIAVVEHPFPVGALVPPHLHTNEDEISIVTEGEIGFRSEDQEVVLGAGGYIVKPRRQVHAMWNAGAAPARMVEIISPAGFEHFFREAVEMMAAGQATAEEGARLSVRYGLEFHDPDWLADVCARYGLAMPGA